MDNQFLAPPRRSRNRVLVAAVALVLVFSVAAVVRFLPHGATLGRAGTATPRGRPTTAEVLPAVSSAAAPAGSDVAAQPSPGAIRLVQGASRTDLGVRVGYPHAMVGAVSAAVEFTSAIASNLDLQRSVDIGALISDGSFGTDPATFTVGPIGLRKLLGLATSGPVPVGASALPSPSAYQVREVSEDSVTVLVLAFYTLRSEVVGSKSYIAVFPSRMVWTGSDWKMANRPATAPDYAELRLQPGSAEAAAAGWLDFLQ